MEAKLNEIKQDGRKKNGCKPGENRNQGPKPLIDRLRDPQLKAELKTVYKVLEADFWVRMANDKAVVRLEAILDDKDAPADLLKFAIKEVNDRAFGKPKEFHDHSTLGEKMENLVIYVPKKESD